jgi:hypothetical protein
MLRRLATQRELAAYASHIVSCAALSQSVLNNTGALFSANINISG